MIKMMQRQAKFATYRTVQYQYSIKPFFSFLKAAILNPREVGSGCPSSSYLANAMAKEISNHSDGIIVELGGGTGAITRALLQQGVTPGRLIVIERSPALVTLLRKQFSTVRIIQGDASELDKLLGPDNGRVSAVVSSLPLKSLPKSCVLKINQQVNKLLDNKGVFVQFTYDLRLPPLSKGQDFSCEHTQVIWKNLPPARVNTFIHTQY